MTLHNPIHAVLDGTLSPFCFSHMLYNVTAPPFQCLCPTSAACTDYIIYIYYICVCYLVDIC